MAKGTLIKRAFLFLFCILFLGLVPSVQTAGPAFGEKEVYVEVHGSNIAHVPITAKYVKYDGKIRRISRFSAALASGEEDCQCPQCCNGRCYIIIYTDFLSPIGPLRVLAILWLEC